jgi:hypothetical protein
MMLSTLPVASSGPPSRPSTLPAGRDVAFFDCVATWIDDVDRRRQVWAMIASTTTRRLRPGHHLP